MRVAVAAGASSARCGRRAPRCAGGSAERRSPRYRPCGETRRSPTRPFDLLEHGHQILGAGEDEDVGLLGVPIPGQPLVRLAGDRGKREAPAEAERAVAGAGVVGERELRTEAGAPRRVSIGTLIEPCRSRGSPRTSPPSPGSRPRPWEARWWAGRNRSPGRHARHRSPRSRPIPEPQMMRLADQPPNHRPFLLSLQYPGTQPRESPVRS